MVQVGGYDPEQEIQAMAIQKKAKESGKTWIRCPNVDAPGIT